MTDCILSIDLEDWFHAHNLSPSSRTDSWERCESRVVKNTHTLLELLDSYSARATFFVLGWVADRFPDLVREIDGRGHEIASHGYNHELLSDQTPQQIRADLERSLDVIEPVVEQRIQGYRAPSFSITDTAIDILADLGFKYDSSSFQVDQHDRYGSIALPADQDGTFVELGNGLVEVQLSMLELPGVRIPWAGGGYFRFIPYPVFRRGVERIVSQGGQYIFYLHPWEIDPEQPVVKDIPASNRIRHYTNIHRTSRKLERLLADFDWEPIEDAL